jgi:putative heme-binding domain-containing protein
VRGPSELQRLEALGLLRAKKSLKKSAPLINPDDTSQPLAERARSWLHVNCSTCHRNGAGGAVAIHLNADKPLKDLRVLDEKPTRGDFGLRAARIIASGDPCRSTLFYRINTEGSGRMPHIGSRLVDESGMALMGAWIQSLPPKETREAEVLSARQRAGDIGAGLARNDHANVPDLLSDMNGALQVLAFIGSGSERSNLKSEVIATARSHTNALLRDLFQRLLPPDQRRRTLGADFDPQTVLALRGDRNRGRDVFFNDGGAQCSRCHQCGDAGRAFGPNLSAIGTKYGRAQLLDEILQPSKVVAPEYRTTSVILRDETEVSGFVLQRTDTELVLRDETLAERRVKLADAKDTRESTVSAMPEGLLAPLTPQEVADLLEFLMTP